MASHTVHSAAAGRNSPSRQPSMHGRLAVWLDRRRERARIAHELLSCNNRELFDLGIGSGDIPAVINGTYRRD